MNWRLPTPCLGLLAACATNVGVEVHEFKPAQNPGGVGVTVLLQRNLIAGNRLEGELLTVGDDGVLVLLDEQLDTDDGKVRLVRVPFWTMRRIDLDQIGAYTVRSEGEALDDSRRARLRVLSRFPQGLSDELLGRLLSLHGQPAVYVPRQAEQASRSAFSENQRAQTQFRRQP